uniref:Gypsy nogag n=1 Tax=Rhipicephalus appendiculatus TaxID=34631 RepID=A0A131YJC7_RHIAP
MPLHADAPLSPAANDDHTTTTALSASINPDLPAAQKEDLSALIRKHSASFDIQSKLLGRTAVAVHRIETEGNSIVRRRPYRASAAERKIEDNVADMLKRGIIRPSSSSWSSPVVLARKKDGSV